MSRKKIKKRSAKSGKAARRPAPQGPAPARNQAGQSSRQPGLSVAMIVRDEEAHLPRALASVKDWAAEMVVVDTGSVDRTVEIARDMGAVVHVHPWEHDFAKHRNQALAYAQGPWVLQLDADEELDPATASQLPGLLAQSGPAAYQVEMVNVMGPGQHTVFHWPRLFRKGPGVHYERKVHNQLVTPGPIAASGLRLFHYGYHQGAAAMAARHQRRLEMMRRWAGEEPANPEAWSYLAQTLVTQPATAAEAANAAMRALDLTPTEERGAPAAYLAHRALAQALNQLSRWPDLELAAMAWHQAMPTHPDPLFYLGRALGAQGRYGPAADAARAFWDLHLALRRQPQLAGGSEVLSTGLLPSFLAVHAEALEALGRGQEIVAPFQAVFMAHRDLARAGVEFLAKCGMTGLARRLGALAAARQPQWGAQCWAAAA